MFAYCLHPGIKDWVKKGGPTNRILVTHALKLCKRSESSRSKQIGCFKTFLRKTIHPQTCPSARGIWREHSRAPTCGKSSFTSAQSTAGAVPEASVDAGLQNLENVSSSEDWLGHKDNIFLKLGMAEFFCFFWQGAWRPLAHKFMMQKYYCVQVLARHCVFFDRMERAGRYLWDQQANEFAASCATFIRGYDKLARLCVQNHVSRFKLIPKMHICRHLAEDIVRFEDNIKHHHCYKDEDCVGIMKTLTCRVHVGSLMEYRIICRWLLRASCWVPGTGSLKNMRLQSDIIPPKKTCMF